MSASTQTAELPVVKQTPPATITNGAKRTRAKDMPAARKAPPKAAARSEATPRSEVPAPVQAAKVEARKAPFGQQVRASMAKSPHPLVEGLLQSFPDQGADISEAKAWMDTANAVLKQILKFPGGLTVTAVPAAA